MFKVIRRELSHKESHLHARRGELKRLREHCRQGNRITPRPEIFGEHFVYHQLFLLYSQLFKNTIRRSK